MYGSGPRAWAYGVGMAELFQPLSLRGLVTHNRVWLPPMCQYQAVDGVPNDYHLVHYGARALGGYGLVIAESTGVTPDGRISPACPGLWNAEQQSAWARIVEFAHAQGALMAIQLNHAGRKSSTWPALPQYSRGTVPVAEGGWEPVGPSAVASEGLATPRALSAAEVGALPRAFANAASRAVAAGFDALEIHGAHGYLIHQFLSPLSNTRTDEWGGSFENRVRLAVEICLAVRAVIPDAMPLIMRVSATDWVEGGWTPEETTRLAGLLAEAGVDFIDVSSGGNVPAEIPVGPGYQVDVATQVRAAGLPVSAVGLITRPEEAAAIVAEERADVVEVGRAALRDPMWPREAARALGVELTPPPSYARAY